MLNCCFILSSIRFHRKVSLHNKIIISLIHLIDILNLTRLNTRSQGSIKGRILFFSISSSVPEGDGLNYLHTRVSVSVLVPLFNIISSVYYTREVLKGDGVLDSISILYQDRSLFNN